MSSAFNYVRTRSRADQLIKRFGQAGVIRRTTTSGPKWDPVTSTTDYDCMLVLLDYEKHDVDGTLILQTDKRVLVSAAGLAIVPATDDKLMLSDTMAIMNVSPLSPGGTIVLYELQARL